MARHWAMHGAGLLPVFTLWSALPGPGPLGHFLAAYLALSLLKIRTFAEHRAHEAHAGRSVIIEDRGPLALLFLNNNLHAVHHAHPNLPWYRLPAEYAARRDEFLRRNRGYRYRSYAQLFAAHSHPRQGPRPPPPPLGDPLGKRGDPPASSGSGAAQATSARRSGP